MELLLNFGINFSICRMEVAFEKPFDNKLWTV